ncbi:Phosphatidylinositol (PI) 3-kinase [Allomyces arbusculus]|nr:Phosphatidylinositol (PI) 3-kinase [Allomyces arbusculus]
MLSTTAANPALRDFSYSISSDIDLHAAVKVTCLRGSLPRLRLKDFDQDPFLEVVAADEPHELFATVTLASRGKPLFLHSQTCFSSIEAVGADLLEWRWDEWVTLPRKVKDLPLDAALDITVHDTTRPGEHHPLGSCSLRLFDDAGMLRRGQYRLPLRTATHPTTDGQPEELANVERLWKRHELGDVERVDWLDKLALREVEVMQENALRASKRLVLVVELPKFDFPVVFNEPVISVSCSDVFDPEIGKENLVEIKHRLLARSHRTEYADRNLKPNSKTRDELQTIISYPPTHALTVTEKDLVWNYRYYLSKDKKALTKFLKAVTWKDPIEVKQAADLMEAWSSPDVDDALELLGPEFEDLNVRSFAVRQLAKADDEELSLYLLQLVQALKFEELNSSVTAESTLNAPNLCDFLISRAADNPNLGCLLFWYLTCETRDKSYGPLFKAVQQRFLDRVLALPDGIYRREILHRQEDLVRKLTDMAKDLRASKDPRPRKIERLRDMIADPKNGLVSFPPLPLPLDPTVQVVGIIPSKASMFKSALMPLRLVFVCMDGSEYPVIFKVGDDLRQDQLVIQLITLMDKLLQKENLDLKLTPYKVLATGPDQGFVQFIPSIPLATILAESNSIQSFLRRHNPDDSISSSYGISANAMDTYVRSCAGYCVITYLLGVGDRHLDNLLLAPKGNLFHIDFGYILGRDPKPFPPPMKLCKEMVEAMGGLGSLHYTRFKNYSYIAFSTLRKSANLILNLLNLMVDANITDIAFEPDKAVVKVQDKFRLGEPEEAAINALGGLITESVTAMFPQVIETIHKWAQYWRK